MQTCSETLPRQDSERIVTHLLHSLPVGEASAVVVLREWLELTGTA